MTTSTASVTVVIPSRNAATTIGAQLDGLARQTYDGEVEVLVVDNDSDDATAATALRWVDRLPGLRVVTATTGHSVSHARNAGIAAATHEIVLVCDADDVVEEHWIEGLLRALGHADLVGGSTVDWDGGALPDGEPEVFGTGGFGFLSSFGGCNFGIRRRVWDTIDGFDETLRSCEDIDFAWRAQLAGFTYAIAPDAIVYYRVSREPRAVYRKWRHDASYQPALYARFRHHGLERQSVPRAAARYLALLATCHRRFSADPQRRVEWSREAGRRMGRLRGSVRARVLYL
jgi:glycosyltransferase involved in cell wall biosynthesis